MLDLNDLRVFEKVAALKGFSAAARVLGLPKSSVSRSVARLEQELGTRLLQRTTREVVLTESGHALQRRCVEVLNQISAAVDAVGNFGSSPRGRLSISAGIGFGINVLSELLPRFLERHPEVSVSVDLSSRSADLVAQSVDVAIRMGPMPDSNIVAKRLGRLQRVLCASKSYLKRHGVPESIDQLSAHDQIEMAAPDGRARIWTFSQPGKKTRHFETAPRIVINDPLTIYRLVANGAGIACVSRYLCEADLAAGRMTHLLSDWHVPAIDVSVVFPSHRELSPVVRAFVDFMRDASVPGIPWLEG
jgi:LysR family transcriptional regulator for bpeEF and oprC